MSDPTPIDCYPLWDAAEKYRQETFGYNPSIGILMPDSTDVREIEKWQQDTAAEREQTRKTKDRILTALVKGELEVFIIDPASGERRFKILPSEWLDNFMPHGLVYSSQIRVFNGDALKKFEGRTPFVDAKAFDAWLALEIGRKGKKELATSPAFINKKQTQELFQSWLSHVQELNKQSNSKQREAFLKRLNPSLKRHQLRTYCKGFKAGRIRADKVLPDDDADRIGDEVIAQRERS